MTKLTPQGDISLKDTYLVEGATKVTSTQFYGDGANVTGVVELGTGAIAKDHGTDSTDEVVNVCYGTGSPPTASTTTEGTLFIQYA